jgi:hypothetical protein
MTKGSDSDKRQHWIYATTGGVPGIGQLGHKDVSKKLMKKDGGQVIKPTPYKSGGHGRKR